MMKKLVPAACALAAVVALGASTATAESLRHFRHDGEARIFRATDPSGQLMAEWHYTGDQGDWVREDDDGKLFLKAQVNDASIVVFVNIGGSFTPVGEGVGQLNVTSFVVPAPDGGYSFTGERFNVESHGVVETFAGTWDFRVSVIQRDGEFMRLFISPPPF